ncbi:BQ2448_257 [Microbotryum intermedium]|uniref:BQ2448_257 protein n=1 Tax=Microbotryum intermedium TaxID=269621 RepID=A0A238FAM6_9BASI|nr:BQ2448_257 [Microbotryum intermedium]
MPVDFDNPPLPPMCLHLSASDYVSSSGIHRSPAPIDEDLRQRAVNNLGLLPSVQHRASIASTDTVYNGSPPRRRYSYDLGLASPKELASHPPLQALITKANGHFGTCAGNVSLISQDKVVYFAEQGFGGVDDLPRKELACDNTLTKTSVQGLPGDDGLRAIEFGELDGVDRSAEGLVIPDLSEDWRFSKAKFSKGFYAGTPIRLPSALGDAFPTRPCGVFCVLSQQARTEPFTKQDRQLLARFADEAGAKLLKVSQERAGKRGAKLLSKYEEFRKASAEATRRGSRQSGDDVAGGASKRASKQQANGNLRSIEQMDQSLERAIRGGNLFERRASPNGSMNPPLKVQLAKGSPTPSNPSTLSGGKPPTTSRSTASSIDSFALDDLCNLSAESAAPVFPRRLARTTRTDPESAGVNAKVSDGIKSSFDLSTRMICESLDLDFCYLLMIDRTTAKASLLSSHNLRLPPPLFHLESHLSASTSQAVLYTRSSSSSGDKIPSTTREDDEVASGLILRVPNKTVALTGLASGGDEKVYVLGAFSTDPRRVVGRQNLAFVKSTMPVLGKGCDEP